MRSSQSGYVVTGTNQVAQAVLSTLTRAGLVALDLRLDRASLDDAFVALVREARPPPRGGLLMTALAALTRNEFRLLRREPLYLFWGLVFPVILLVVLGSIPAFREVSADLGGVTLIATYTPVIVVLSMAFTSVAGLPTVVGTYRERLILKRLATTPVGSARLLAALMVQNLVTTLGMTALVLLVARLAFGVALPGSHWRGC